jgi:V-type H+-transporting ATPase subunit D
LQSLSGLQEILGNQFLTISQRVRESVTRASIRLDMSEDNVAGVTLPKFVIRTIEDSEIHFEKVGVFGGGQIIDQTREKFKEFLKLVVDIASLQTSFLTLDEVIKVTSRRVAALEHIVIPRFQSVVTYIIQELDEQAREEKYTYVLP